MKSDERFEVREAHWGDDRGALLEVRTAVFVVEQGVDVRIERDGRDGECWHALAFDATRCPIGAGRLMPGGKIGRVAVLREWRGRGVGLALMGLLLELADREEIPESYLHSQTDAAGFYARFGFVTEGEEFEEAGIPHVRMVRARHLPRMGD